MSREAIYSAGPIYLRGINTDSLIQQPDAVENFLSFLPFLPPDQIASLTRVITNPYIQPDQSNDPRIDFMKKFVRKSGRFDNDCWDIITTKVFPDLDKIVRWDGDKEKSDPLYLLTAARYKESDLTHSLGTAVWSAYAMATIIQNAEENWPIDQKDKLIELAIRMALCHDWAEIIKGDIADLDSRHASRQASGEQEALAAYVNTLPIDKVSQAEFIVLGSLFEDYDDGKIEVSDSLNLIRAVVKWADAMAGAQIFTTGESADLSTLMGNILGSPRGLTNRNIINTFSKLERVTNKINEILKHTNYFSATDSVKTQQEQALSQFSAQTNATMFSQIEVRTDQPIRIRRFDPSD